MKSTYPCDNGLITGVARVVEVDSSQAWLAAEQPAACSSCATKGVCASGTPHSSASWRVARSLGPNQAPLALGERVEIGVDRNAVTRASLAAYSLPLFTMLTAVIAMQDAGNGAAVLGAAVGLAAGAAAARKLVRRWRESLAPVVLGRAADPPCITCAPASTVTQRHIATPVIPHGSL